MKNKSIKTLILIILVCFAVLLAFFNNKSVPTVEIPPSPTPLPSSASNPKNTLSFTSVEGLSFDQIPTSMENFIFTETSQDDLMKLMAKEYKLTPVDDKKQFWTNNEKSTFLTFEEDGQVMVLSWVTKQSNSTGIDPAKAEVSAKKLLENLELNQFTLDVEKSKYISKNITEFESLEDLTNLPPDKASFVIFPLKQVLNKFPLQYGSMNRNKTIICLDAQASPVYISVPYQTGQFSQKELVSTLSSREILANFSEGNFITTFISPLKLKNVNSGKLFIISQSIEYRINSTDGRVSPYLAIVGRSDQYDRIEISVPITKNYPL